MKYLLPILMVLLFACNGPPPDVCDDERAAVPICETTGGEWKPVNDEDCICECPDGMEWKGVEHGCQPKQPPTTTTVDPDPQPENYKRIEVTQAEARFLRSNDGLPYHIWRCVRTPQYMIDRCSMCLRAMDLHPGELQTFVNNAEKTHAKFYDDNWLMRMELVNRRCIPSDPTDPWCKRSNIRKTVWNEDYKPLRMVFDAELSQTEDWMRTAEQIWEVPVDSWGHLCQMIERQEIPCIP